MTSTRANGNKLSILISLLMAMVLIGVMVFMSRENMQYSIPVSSFHPNGDIFCRLDGIVTVKDSRLALCESGQCVWIEVPPGQTLESGRHVQIEGLYHEGILEASRILMRCDMSEGNRSDGLD